MGSTFPRIARVLVDLAVHPQYIPKCFTHNVMNGKTGLDLQLPPFCYAATDFLSKHLQSHMTVCEYGSGGSTLFFARHARSVFSIESDAQRYDLVTQHIRKQSVRNVRVQLHLLNAKQERAF